MFWSSDELEELKGTSVVGLFVPVDRNRASFERCDTQIKSVERMPSGIITKNSYPLYM
jgi:hypothetical protein